MMTAENPIRLIRELKGAPLSIVLVLQIVRQRVTQEYLERATGYTDKPVSQALEYLREIGMADHTREGWQLCVARQLPLGFEEIETPRAQRENEGEEEQDNHRDTEIIDGREEQDNEFRGSDLAENGGVHAQSTGVSRKYSDSLIIITDSDSINLERCSSNNNNSPPSRKNSDSDNSSPDLFEQNLAALKAARVVGAKRQELARLDHVTPGYVRAWEAQLKHEAGERYTPGLLIVTIEGGLPAPGVRENGHVLSCSCDECRRRAYEAPP